MSTPSVTKPSVRHRIAEELEVVLALSLYLYICLGALLLLKTATLREAGISYTAWGAAAIKAVVLAKFMVVGQAMHVGQRHMDKPLIWPTLQKALLFLILLLILTTIEEVAVGLIHARPLSESLRHIVGPTFFGGLAVTLLMFLILVPYSAFTSLAAVMGEDKLVRLFFFERTTSRS